MSSLVFTGRDAPYVCTDRACTLVARRGERTTVIHRIGDSGSYTFDLTVEPGASVTVISVQLLQGTATVLRQRSSVADGASVDWHNVTLGGGHIEHTLLSECTGAHAQSSVDWLFAAHRNDHFDLRVRNVFSACDGGGKILMRGIAEQEASVACHGMIAIGPGGGGTDTYLTQEVLMLDATAKVDAVPGLEIKTNDVKASHSATVSTVGLEDLFYLSSRGIGGEEARRILIRGFLEQIVERIEYVDARERVLAAIEEKLLRS